jgi:SRSO17 transposase
MASQRRKADVEHFKIEVQRGSGREALAFDIDSLRVHASGPDSPVNLTYEKEWSRMAICRRSVDDPNDVRHFLAFCKSDVYVEEIIAAAGRRWTIEEDFEVTEGELGLDHYKVRSVKGWYCHLQL